MPNTDAGHSASECTATTVNAPSKHSITPAARKFAEYLARRLAPMIEYSAKQPAQANADANQANKD
jgi:hypothetical protein